LYLESNREKFEKSFLKKFPKSFALSFDSLFGQKSQQLRGLSYLVLYRRTLPGRQSPGRPLHGRIVVPAVPDHYM
jgi:hypothetical protein